MSEQVVVTEHVSEWVSEQVVVTEHVSEWVMGEWAGGSDRACE